MAGCERCWSEANRRVHGAYDSVTEAYHAILAERDAAGIVCTPEEQCGELHLLWDKKSCRCGQRTLP